MSGRIGGLISAAVGLAVIASALLGFHTNYVREGLRWPLVVSGLVVVAVGMITARGGHGSAGDTPSHVPGVGLMLVAFAVALVTVPPPLGASAAEDRVPNRGVSPAAAVLASSDDAPGTTTDLYEFVSTVYFDPEAVLGQPVTLEGFIATEPDIPGAVRLTQYVISCCAADAFPLQVTLIGLADTPARDQWVRAEVVWDGEQTAIDEYGDGVPIVEVLDLTEIAEPANPYQS